MYASTRPVLRVAELVVAAVLVAVTANAISAPGTSVAATSTVYTATVTGTEARGLLPHVQPRLISNTGGGVFPETQGAVEVSPQYLEVAIDLPANAKITSVSIIQQACRIDPNDLTYSFGSYGPSGGNFVDYADLTATLPGAGCGKSTLTKTGNPLATVAAVRRYVIDWVLTTGGFQYTASPDAASRPLFIGAQVKYTCAAPCIP